MFAYAGSNDLKDEGVGTYSDASVADQISNFTINRQTVSCDVGTVSPGSVITGPFAMLMYAKDIVNYSADRSTKTIMASGQMRSVLVEDVEHYFIAIAKDNGAMGDRFDVHSHTPFWKPGNPFCTPSTQFAGECRFGGELLTDALHTHQLGDVVVGP